MATIATTNTRCVTERVDFLPQNFSAFAIAKCYLGCARALMVLFKVAILKVAKLRSVAIAVCLPACT